MKTESLSIYEIVNRRGLQEAATARHKALFRLGVHPLSSFSKSYSYGHGFCNDCYREVLLQYKEEELLVKNGSVAE